MIMKKRIFVLMLLIFISSVSAQNVCEYNGVKTEYGLNYQTPGEKSEYADEQFVHLTDAKAIKELEQLKGLICLESADFYAQGISGDLESFRTLVNLKVLSLHTNPNVEGDLCVFSKATKLKSLKLAFDEKVYGDISCLKDLNLETMAMTYTKISGDLSDLSHMTHLKALYLSGTDITGDISALSGLINLEELTLSDAEADGSKFYGDLASLDNLKKLRRVAIYNMKATNCELFTEAHPNIKEGGCSDKSKSTVINTNVNSEKMIGKGDSTSINFPKDEWSKSNDEPPETCIVNQQFIGEDKCKALVDKASSGKSPDKSPPEECIVNGEFIGEGKCRAMMEKMPGAQSEKKELQEIESQETELQESESQRKGAVRSFLQKVMGWFGSLFR